MLPLLLADKIGQQQLAKLLFPKMIENLNPRLTSLQVLQECKGTATNSGQWDLVSSFKCKDLAQF